MPFCLTIRLSVGLAILDPFQEHTAFCNRLIAIGRDVACYSVDAIVDDGASWGDDLDTSIGGEG